MGDGLGISSTRVGEHAGVYAYDPPWLTVWQTSGMSRFWPYSLTHNGDEDGFIPARSVRPDALESWKKETGSWQWRSLVKTGRHAVALAGLGV